jgi:hypothetical protein
MNLPLAIRLHGGNSRRLAKIFFNGSLIDLNGALP